MRRHEQVREIRRLAGTDACDHLGGWWVKQRSTAGFSLIEILVALAIVSVIAVIAIPLTTNAVRSTRLSAAVSSATGAIQSTRYLAIMKGYPYQITFTPSNVSYQVLNEVPPAATFANVGTTIPICGPGAAAISRTITLQFAANGTVSEVTTPPAGVSAMVFSITNSYGGSKTITVSSVGNVTVTSP